MFLIFLATLANSLRDSNPGIGAYLDLAYLNETFIQLLPIAEVFGAPQIPIPDQYKTFSFSGMEVVLNATNIKINSLLTDTTGTGFYALADNYLGVHIANTHVNVSCDYSANILGSPEKGSAWIYIDGIDLRTAATFEIQDGFPAISIKSTNFTYNSFSLKTDLESFLQDLIVSTLEQEKSMVESTLNSLLDGLSSTVNPILSGLNYGLQLSYLGFNVTADIKPVRGLELTDKQASLFLNGTIFDTNNPKNFNYPNSAFSAPTINQPLALQIGQGAVNQAVASLWPYADLDVNGLLNLNVTTKLLGIVIPQLAKVYGPDDTVQIVFKSDADLPGPDVVLFEGGAKVNVENYINFVPYNSKGNQEKDQIDLQMELNAGALLSLNNTQISVNVQNIGVQAIGQAKTGNPDLAVNLKIINEMLGDLAVILVDLANEELANITYNYPTIPFFLISTADGVCHNGYLEGGIDLLFHPF